MGKDPMYVRYVKKDFKIKVHCRFTFLHTKKKHHLDVKLVKGDAQMQVQD